MRVVFMRHLLLFAAPMRALLVVLLLVSCGQPYGSRHWPRSREARPQLVFDVDVDVAALQRERFWDAPFPSDARLTKDGAPDVSGLPNPWGIPFVEKSKQAILNGVKVNGRGFSPLPV